jgi:hypothetical protein
MKAIKIVCMGIGLACAGTGLADSSASPTDAKNLGMAEAMMGFCKKADPADVAKYEAIIKQLVSGQSAKTLAEVRASDAYRDAFAAMNDFASKVDPHNAKTICTESLAQRK